MTQMTEDECADHPIVIEFDLEVMKETIRRRLRRFRDAGLIDPRLLDDGGEE